MRLSEKSARIIASILRDRDPAVGQPFSIGHSLVAKFFERLDEPETIAECACHTENSKESAQAVFSKDMRSGAEALTTGRQDHILSRKSSTMISSSRIRVCAMALMNSIPSRRSRTIQ